jgi:hypothetical protein
MLAITKAPIGPLERFGGLVRSYRGGDMLWQMGG